MSVSEIKLPPPKSLEDLGTDYRRLCMKAGDLQYKVYLAQRDLDQVNEQLREIGFEALRAKQAAESATKESDNASSS